MEDVPHGGEQTPFLEHKQNSRFIDMELGQSLGDISSHGSFYVVEKSVLQSLSSLPGVVGTSSLLVNVVISGLWEVTSDWCI